MWLFNNAKQVIPTTWTIPSSQWNQPLLLKVMTSFLCLILAILNMKYLRRDFLLLLSLNYASDIVLTSKKPLAVALLGFMSRICYAIWLIGTCKAENAVQVTKVLHNNTNQPLSAQTVQNSMKEVGMKAVVKKKRPFLSKRHRRERLDFALSHKDWTIDDWKKVFWSDETKINCLGSDGRQWVWEKKVEGLQPFAKMMALAADFQRIRKFMKFDWNLQTCQTAVPCTIVLRFYT